MLPRCRTAGDKPGLSRPAARSARAVQARGQEQLRTASVAAQSQPEPERSPSRSRSPSSSPRAQAVAVNGGGSIDEISTDEFERLLDRLHGVGKAPTVSAAPVLSGSRGHHGRRVRGAARPAPRPGPARWCPDLSPLQSIQKEVDELIDDDEFERLLDELHGRGQGPQHSMAAAAPAPEPKAPTAPP